MCWILRLACEHPHGQTSGTGPGSGSRSGRLAAEFPAQVVLGGLQRAPLGGGQAVAGPVDVEGQHRPSCLKTPFCRSIALLAAVTSADHLVDAMAGSRCGSKTDNSSPPRVV